MLKLKKLKLPYTHRIQKANATFTHAGLTTRFDHVYTCST